MNEDSFQKRYARSSPMEDVYLPYEESAAPEARRRGFRMNRFAGALLLLLPAGMAIANVPGTLLLFSDTEGTTANELTAAPLDFSVDVDTPSAIALTAGEGEENGDAFSPFVIPAPGTSDFEYTITVEEQGGDHAFCEALWLKGVPPLFPYDDLLLNLSTATTTETAPWSLLLYIEEGAIVADGAVCVIDLVYSGFQEEGEEGQQFHDEERLTLVITADVVAEAFKVAPESQSLLSVPEEPIVEEEPEEEEPVIETPTPEELSVEESPVELEPEPMLEEETELEPEPESVSTE